MYTSGPRHQTRRRAELFHNGTAGAKGAVTKALEVCQTLHPLVGVCEGFRPGEAAEQATEAHAPPEFLPKLVAAAGLQPHQLALLSHAAGQVADEDHGRVLFELVKREVVGRIGALVQDRLMALKVARQHTGWERLDAYLAVRHQVDLVNEPLHIDFP